MSAESRILKNLDLDGAVELCAELVRIPSPIGQEKAAALFIADKLRSIGVDEVDLIEGEPDRPNVLGRVKGKSEHPGLMFYGHIDSEHVLDGWTVEPYAGLIKDGKVYGRASKDMRAGIAAFIKVTEAIIKSGLKPNSDLTLAFCVDEETAGDKGIGHLVELGLINSAYGLYGETYEFGEIMVADSGTIWFELTTHGVGQHTQLDSHKRHGINAVEKMARAITELQKLDLAYEEHPLFKGMRPCIYCGTSIESRVGMHPCMIPERCKATFDVRLVPGQDADEVLKRIIGILDGLKAEDPEFKYDINILKKREPTQVPLDHPFLVAAQECIKEVSGKDAVLRGHEMTSDQAYIRSAGVVSVHLGPGNLLAHKPDEYIDIWQIKQAAQIYAKMAARFLF